MKGKVACSRFLQVNLMKVLLIDKRYTNLFWCIEMWNNSSKPKPETSRLNYSNDMLRPVKGQTSKKPLKCWTSPSPAKIWAFNAVFKTNCWTTHYILLHPHSYFLPIYDWASYVVYSVLIPRLKFCMLLSYLLWILYNNITQ